MDSRARVDPEGVQECQPLFKASAEPSAPAAYQLWPLKVLYTVNACTTFLYVQFVTTYWVHTGLSTLEIGALASLRPVMSFFGELLLASVAEQFVGFHATAITCNLLGLLSFLSILFVRSFPGILVLYGFSGLVLSWNGLRDAHTLELLEMAGRGSDFGIVRKYASIGRGVCALSIGFLTDALGGRAMFAVFAVLQVALLLVLSHMMVQGTGATVKGGRTKDRPAPGPLLPTLRNGWAMIFLANLLLYSGFKALITLLYVYVLRGFEGSSDALCSTITVVMALGETLAFQFADRAFGWGFTALYSVCHLTLAVRMLWYAAVPARRPWLILLAEPLHGVTFALMWAGTVEFVRRHAPPNCGARMQALASGTYMQLGAALGSAAWARAIEGVGFRWSYGLCACAVALWCLLYNALLRCAAPPKAAGAP